MIEDKKDSREVIYKGNLYYWCTSPINGYALSITDSNQDLFLYYQLDQNKNSFLSPQIAVWTKNEKIRSGRYHLSSSLIADDIDSISDDTMFTLLDWYYTLPEDIQPIIYQDIQLHPFEQIDFKRGVIQHIALSFSIFDLIEKDRENLLSVVFPNGFTLNVSWYKSTKDISYYARKEFTVDILYKNDSKNPIFELDRNWQTLRETLINLVEYIG